MTTYISLEEMNIYVKENYVSSDPLRIQWEAMSVDDQNVYLRRSYDYINSLPFTGRPARVDQPGAFPRKDNFSSQDFLKVKYAQAEQALTMSDVVASSETEDRLRLRRAGVVEYSIGDLSEKFSGGVATSSLCESARRYLSKWLQGGFHICTSIKKPCGR